MKGTFTINTEVSKVNKPNLISLPNPCYIDAIQQNSHLKGIQMNDNGEKTELPIYVKAYFRIQGKRSTCSKRASYHGNTS